MGDCKTWIRGKQTLSGRMWLLFVSSKSPHLQHEDVFVFCCWFQPHCVLPVGYWMSEPFSIFSSLTQLSHFTYKDKNTHKATASFSMEQKYAYIPTKKAFIYCLHFSLQLSHCMCLPIHQLLLSNIHCTRKHFPEIFKRRSWKTWKHSSKSGPIPNSALRPPHSYFVAVVENICPRAAYCAWLYLEQGLHETR